MCLAVLALACPQGQRNLSSELSQTYLNESDRNEMDWNWVVVANRDEVHDRPSTDMQPWDDDPQILAGRDLKAGGSWLGVHTDGRFALLTNYREPGKQRADAPSRGFLVEQFLRQSVTPETYLDALNPISQQYNGFNLLIGRDGDWWHASNRLPGWKQLIGWQETSRSPSASDPVVSAYGLSNALFDTPWPKVIRTREAVYQRLLDGRISLDVLADAMRDCEPAPDVELPRTGLALDRERLLSSPFILSPEYGTRCTTVVMQKRDGSILAQETTYFPDGRTKNRSGWCTQGDTWSRIEV
ncbi:NRDE family protein [Orrella marina]|nr:NRDE family protein [Orrella marina]